MGTATCSASPSIRRPTHRSRPRTARGIGYRGSIKALYNPDTNLRWGMKYLGEAYRRGGKSVCGTIMKYNGGHYAKRHTRWSRAYCAKVQRILARRGAD